MLTYFDFSIRLRTCSRHRLEMRTEKKKAPKYDVNELPVGYGGLFLDSGAHSLYTREVIQKAHSKGYEFYKTPEFRTYVDSYAKFIKHFEGYVDYYVNVDAIFNPELTWETQLYLEKEHGLRPVPVIHYGTPLKWVERYLKHAEETGLDLIGLGGLGQEVRKDQYYGWADKVFAMLCPASNKNLPLVRTHGFAMTSWELIFRYPWWSVDSASWVKASAFGQVYVPHKRGGKYVFTERPYSITVSSDSPNASQAGKHLSNITKAEQDIVHEWLRKIKVPLGDPDYKGDDPAKRGVTNHYQPRVRANLIYFEEMIAQIPAYPWAYKPIPEREGLGLVI